jgi:hypothetical protein
LAQTAELWEPIGRAQRWVRAAAQVLANEEKRPGSEVRQELARVLRSIGVTKRHCGPLEAGLDHFLKVTRSYRSGLFHCYEDEAIPRTNNDLEHCFAQHRYHERRATGRKAGSPSIVLHGPVRLIASTASRLKEFTPSDLALRERERWRSLRQAVRRRFSVRTQGRRFRRDPDAYLAQLEQAALK